MVDGLLNSEEINYYRQLYDDLLSGKIDASSHRHDLGSHVKQKVQARHVLYRFCLKILVEIGFIEKLSTKITVFEIIKKCLKPCSTTILIRKTTFNPFDSVPLETLRLEIS